MNVMLVSGELCNEAIGEEFLKIYSRCRKPDRTNILLLITESMDELQIVQSVRNITCYNVRQDLLDAIIISNPSTSKYKEEDWVKLLEHVALICVGGDDTKNLAHIFRTRSFRKVVVSRIRQGQLALVTQRAGSCAVGEHIGFCLEDYYDDSESPTALLPMNKGLGLFEGYIFEKGQYGNSRMARERSKHSKTSSPSLFA